MAAISQKIFSDDCSWMKSFVFWLKFHWSLFLRVQLTISQHWFRYVYIYLYDCTYTLICSNSGKITSYFFHQLHFLQNLLPKKITNISTKFPREMQKEYYYASKISLSAYFAHWGLNRDYSGFGFSQWETLHCSVISHWLIAASSLTGRVHTQDDPCWIN